MLGLDLAVALTLKLKMAQGVGVRVGVRVTAKSKHIESRESLMATDVSSGTLTPRSVIPVVLAIALVVLTGLTAYGADSVVVFNEIMYHPATNEAAFEWLELHNQLAVNVDISSWSIAGGAQFQFPEGTIVPGGG